MDDRDLAPSLSVDIVNISLAADRARRAARREALVAAGLVGAFVGVPAAIAAGAALALFALATFVLLAPAVAAFLIWVVWRECRRGAAETRPPVRHLRAVSAGPRCAGR